MELLLLPNYPCLQLFSKTPLRIGRVSQIATTTPADKQGTTDRVDRGTRCAEQRLC